MFLNWDYINLYFYLVPPRWILEPTDKAFAQGGDAKIECKADGFPKPQVTWKKAIGEHYLIIQIYKLQFYIIGNIITQINYLKYCNVWLCR